MAIGSSGNEPLSQADIDAAIAAAMAMPEETFEEGAAEPEAAPAPTAAPPVAAASSAPARPLFQPMDEPEIPAANEPQNLGIVMDIPLEVSVELGRRRMSIRDILDLGSGSIVELDKIAGEPVDLLVNGRLVARGEVVVIEDNFGVRITEIIGAAARNGEKRPSE